MFAYAWEYRVRPDAIDEFVRHYGPGGSWVVLFSRADGYLGTRLLRDREDPERFVTIDTWVTAAACAAFRERFAADFDALDAACEALTLEERHLGDFDTAYAEGRHAPDGSSGWVA